MSLAGAIHPVTPIASRFLRATGRRFRRLAGKVDQITALQFAVRFHAGLDSGNWRRHGENLIAHCAAHRQPVLMVIDEIPIFLARLLRHEDGRQRVDEFLSWLRAVFQKGDSGHPVLILSGSIGLAPLVERLGISDRINYLDSIRLRPWDLETSVQCFEKLMTAYGPTLAVLVHDDYLEPHPDGHRFMMNLLRDWWRARFRHHYRPLAENRPIGFREGDTP